MRLAPENMVKSARGDGTAILVDRVTLQRIYPIGFAPSSPEPRFASSSRVELSMHKGKVVILTIFATAAAMASYAVYHHYQRGRQILDRWGTQHAQRIRHARRVELLDLGPGPDPSTLKGALAVERVINISKKRGLVHARHTLVIDASFAWPGPKRQPVPQWDFAIRFADNQQRTTLLFDTDNRWVGLVEQEDVLGMTEVIERLAQFVTPLLEMDANTK